MPAPATHAALFSLVIALLATGSATGQKKPNPAKTAVDVVSVKGLGKLSGFILSQSNEKLVLAVRRQWLAKTHNDFYKKHLDAEKASSGSISARRRERLEAWKKEKQNLDIDGFLADFIDGALRAEPKDPPDPTTLDFTIVELGTTQIRKVYAKTENQRQLAGIGWSLKMDSVESLSASALARRLKKRNIDIEHHNVNLADQLPVTLEFDEQWAIRKSLVEFALLPRLEFQGSGSTYFRRGAEVNPLQLIGPMLQGESGFGFGGDVGAMGKELGLPEFKNFPSREEKTTSAIDRMIRTAEKENRSAFSATTLDQGRFVKVTTDLYLKGSDGKWKVFRSFSTSEDPSDQPQEDIDALLDQPQIKRIADLSKQFGLGGGGTMDQAVRNGVATQKALDQVMTKMDRYVDEFSQSVDSPSISQ